VSEADVSTCPNCGAPLAGQYCSRCGQEALAADKLTVRHFVSHAIFDEILNLDGKIWRTVYLLLFRPGFLASEYSEGRRRSYVNPVRLLITAILVYAVATFGGLTMRLWVGPFSLSVAPASVPLERPLADTLVQIDGFGVLGPMVEARIGDPQTASAAVSREFNATLRNFATPVSFTVVLLFASALYALFWRRRPSFVEHLVFGIHYYCCVLVWSAVSAVGIAFGLLSLPVLLTIIVLALLLWQFAYLTIAVRRFYLAADARRIMPWVTSAIVAVLLYVLNSVFVTVVQLVGALMAVWRL
jgi:hypothetical protein